MRKLKLQTQVSVDGFMAGPNGEMDWMVWNWDEALKQYVMDLTEPVDTILLGRVLAQGFIPHWSNVATNPDTTDPFSNKMHGTPKVVFSKTLHTHDWSFTELTNGDLVEEVTRLKNQEGGDMIAYGGANFVSNLIENNLIDEYHLFLNPVLAGRGMPIFQSADARRKLKLIKATGFDCGITVLHYEPADNSNA